MTGPTRVVVDPRLGAVLPAAAVGAVARASAVLLDPALPGSVAAVFARELGAVPARPEDLDAAASAGTAGDGGAAGAVVLVPGRDPDAPAGAELLEAVAVMDRLRSPGGCPWDAEQTHASLLRYLVEETYELYDALAAGAADDVREELGDVLLQVLFHARLGEEADAPWGVDAVAAGLVAKLVGRHPHVFGTDAADAADVVTAGDQDRRWEELKAVEKRRASVLDGVAAAQPAAALLAKYASRARRAGVPEDLLRPEDPLAARVVDASRDGRDPEGVLRAAAAALAAQVRSAEAGFAPGDGADPDPVRWRRHWPSGA